MHAHTQAQKDGRTDGQTGRHLIFLFIDLVKSVDGFFCGGLNWLLSWGKMGGGEGAGGLGCLNIADVCSFPLFPILTLARDPRDAAVGVVGKDRLIIIINDVGHGGLRYQRRHQTPSPSDLD